VREVLVYPDGLRVVTLLRDRGGTATLEDLGAAMGTEAPQRPWQALARGLCELRPLGVLEVADAGGRPVAVGDLALALALPTRRREVTSHVVRLLPGSRVLREAPRAAA
jgi:hypothetical protein